MRRLREQVRGAVGMAMVQNEASVMKKLLSAVLLLWPGMLYAQDVQYYHLDAIGNVRAVTDQAGAVIERHDYLPFGEECTTGPCASNPGVTGGQPKHFTGKESDTETGLDYFGARYYGSKIGRFTSVDPKLNMRRASRIPNGGTAATPMGSTIRPGLSILTVEEGAEINQNRDIRAPAQRSDVRCGIQRRAERSASSRRRDWTRTPPRCERPSLATKR